MNTFEQYVSTQTQRRYARIVGRGTTALFVALRAIANDRSGEIILPDIICSTVLDAVLLAGLKPVYADIDPDRFGITAETVRSKITPDTIAIIAGHIFGYGQPIPELRRFGIPIIEDAVQGFGGATPDGEQVGMSGDLSIISFDSTKMIGGRGGVVLTDDPRWEERLHQIALDPIMPPDEKPPYNRYRRQIAPLVPSLLCEFNTNLNAAIGSANNNIQHIQMDWQRLDQNVRERREKANYLADQLADLPLNLPTLYPIDAVWRYTFAAPTIQQTNRILRQLQLAGLPGSHLYPALSSIYDPDHAGKVSADIAPRLINLWVDQHTTFEMLDSMIEIIRRCVA